MDPSQYAKMMDFVETLLVSLDVSLEKTRIATITFANKAVVRFNLDKYGDTLDVVDAVMNFERQSGVTNTGDALKLLREFTFKEVNGARPGVLKIGLVITADKSRDMDDTLRQAAIGRSMGYMLYGVGVGENIDIDELQGIAGLQYPDRIFTAESFDDMFDTLVSVNHKIVNITCDGKYSFHECEPSSQFNTLLDTMVLIQSSSPTHSQLLLRPLNTGTAFVPPV